jgi:TonB family protein
MFFFAARGVFSFVAAGVGRNGYRASMRLRILLAPVLLLAMTARADQWSLPERTTWHSADRQWRLVITPKQLESQLSYFADNVAGEADPGARKDVPRNYARAALYRKGRFALWRQVAYWPLVNGVAPVSALVANDGTVVTFDNWHGMGYGDDVVVIYRPDGTLVRKLGLTDLMNQYDVDQLSHSVSSIWWSRTHRIDEDRRQLVLQIDARKVEEVPLSLDTGEMLVPKGALFRRPQVTWTGKVLATGDDIATVATSACAPDYPPIARKAHVTGDVILEFVINAAGHAEEMKVLKPLPFGAEEAAREALAMWHFQPPRGEEPAYAQVTFSFLMPVP